MRLWHYELLPYLPKSQLLSQKRECDLILKAMSEGKKINHILINYIYDDIYSISFKIYYSLLYKEFKNRGYKFNDKYNYVNEIYYKENFIPFVNHHNFDYFCMCYWNLKEKYMRGQKDFTQETWDKIEEMMEGKMSNMNFNCDVCGREVLGCTFVNGMKFCAKCYQETFGETDKDRKIADLEAKLAESESKRKILEEKVKCLSEENEECFVDGQKYNELREQKDKENQQLKQQLAEKEKEIANLNGLVRERDKQIKNLKTNKKRVIEHKNKTKISFALEQLEKVKDYFIEGYAVCKNFSDFYWNFTEQIDNQIKELEL